MTSVTEGNVNSGNTRRCDKCGSVVPENSLASVCPRCALLLGLEATADLAEKAGDMIGGFKLIHLLGEGGMGRVWMAEQTKPIRRTVALKVLKAGMDSAEVLARFESERQALALMDHPNIARIFDGGATPQGRPLFAMELVKGVPLTRFCDEERLSISERLELFTQVCHAVQHAHQKGIIHRDLKPSNVLVAMYDGKPVPKVIDFGVAKALGQRLTERTLYTLPGHMVGTLEYMAPEQAELNQLDIDTRSDVYSLGVLLYELLTGTTPLTREALRQAGLEEILRRIRDEEPPRPSVRLSTTGREQLPSISIQRKLEPEKLTRKVRGDLDWIVMKCLEKDRARRYETSSGLAADIQRHLNNEPVLARPPGNLYRFQKTVRRHKLVFAAAGAILTSLVIGLAATSIMFFKEQAARSEVGRKNTELERKSAEFRGMLAEAARSDRLVAKEKLQLWQEQEAFAHLARACQYDPSSTLPAEISIAALGSWRHELPISILVGHTKGLSSARFNPEGTRIVTASFDETARVWNAVTGRLLVTLAGHTGEVSSAEFSPDGSRIVTGSYDNTARVWDPATGELLTTLAGHVGAVTGAQFSPDGTRIVTKSSDKTARVWDANSGIEVVTLSGHRQKPGILMMAQFSPDGTRIATIAARTLLVSDAVTGMTLVTLAGLGHGGHLRSARFNPEGTRIVTASSDGTARVWDAATGRVLATMVGHEGSVENAQFSPDGTLIVTAGRDDKTVRLWKAGTGELLKTLTGHAGEVHSAEFSPDGDRIVSWSKSDSTARVWDASTGRELVTLAGHHEGVGSAHISSDGKLIVTASNDKTARIWDATTMQATPSKHSRLMDSSSDGERVAVVLNDNSVRVWEIATRVALATLNGHTGKVWRSKFNVDGSRIITMSFQSPPRLWETATGKALATLSGTKGRVRVVEFSPDGTRIVTAPTGEPARLWDAATGRMLGMFAGETGEVERAQFSSDGKLVITQSHEAVHVWDAATRKELATFGHTGERWAAQVSVDGTRIVTSSDDRTVRVWDATTGKLLAALAGYKGAAWAKLSPDGTIILMGSTDQTVRVWNAATGKEIAIFAGHSGKLENTEFSLDGTRIIATFTTEPTRLWDATTGKILATFEDKTLPTFGVKLSSNAEFSPDGKRIVATAGGSVAELWDSATGKALKKLTGHTGQVLSARFSRNGAHIVATSNIEEVHVWDAKTGEQLAILDGSETGLWSAQFSSDGTRIIATSYDGMVRVWDVLPKGASPPPEWFPDFLRYVAQMRLNPDGELETLRMADWLALGERLRGVQRASAGVNTPYLRILRKYVPDSLLTAGSQILIRVNSGEAQIDFCRANKIPLRQGNAGSHLIDLTMYYNAGLYRNWHGDARENNLEELPIGVRNFNGTQFDVRGLVQVTLRTSAYPEYPSAVRGIAIGKRCHKLHFLHSAIDAGSVADGSRIGRYVVHYRTGKEQEIPLVVGTDIGDWFEQSGEPGRSFIAWKGTNAKSRRRQAHVRLFQSTWVNPFPELDIQSLDFEAIDQQASPFLVAITVDDKD